MQRINRKDLPNYRLACKLFAEAGRSEMFHTILVRNTLSSVAALKHITQDEHLAEFVKTMVWDLTSWRVGDSVRDWHEWTRYCAKQAQEGNSDQATLYRELAASRHHWEAYLSRLEGEKDARKDIRDLMFQDALASSLPNLQTVHVFRGAQQIEDRRACGSLESKFPQAATRSLDKWRGDKDSSGSAAAWKDHYVLATSVGTKLRMYGLRKDDLLWLSSDDWTNVNCEEVTSIKIKADVSPVRHYKEVGLYWFLRRFPKLESLALDPNEHDSKMDGEVFTLAIQDVFENTLLPQLSCRPYEALTWKNLRKLSLAHFKSLPRTLLFLVAGHSSTLRDLRLRNMLLDDLEWCRFDAHGTWREIFCTIGTITKLERVVLSGVFRHENHEDDVWDFDDIDLAGRVSDCIIYGKECPMPRGSR